MNDKTLVIKDLSVEIETTGVKIVKNLNLELTAGEIYALVGESGSGKTMAARAILDLLPHGLKLTQESEIALSGRDLTSLTPREICQIRGAEIGMVFQEPMISLNPSMRIGEQMAEGLALHRNMSAAEIRKVSLEMLRQIQIRDPESCLEAYPHEFSGGMRQRIMLASVMLLKPKILIADEPTTALDTLVQRDVLDLMVKLCKENDTAILLISHDLGMVSHYADMVAVMHNGTVVEQGRAKDVLNSPQHDYTKNLLDALPARGIERAAKNITKNPIIEIENLDIGYPVKTGFFSKDKIKTVVSGLNLTINSGEILALVGASGSGKTTVGRAIIGLVKPLSGAIRFKGQHIVGGGVKTTSYHENMQMIFQDPHSSLDPKQKVITIVAEPLKLEKGMSKEARRERVLETCEAVGLGKHLINRLPHQLSGGQRQRVAIARAIVRRPQFIVADEPISALDMTVQKQILKLIEQLQEKFGFACLFISHDLGAVEQIAGRVAVMQDGIIVETGSRDDVFDRPQHTYTKKLLNAAMLLGRDFGE